MQSTVAMVGIGVSLAVHDGPNEYDEDDANDDAGDELVQPFKP